MQHVHAEDDRGISEPFIRIKMGGMKELRLGFAAWLQEDDHALKVR